MKKFIVALTFLAVSTACQSQKSTAVFSTKAGAIKGYDPVAYFVAGKPEKGEKDLIFEWKGAKWHFSTAENQRLFAENPEKYAPEYGGFCAYGLAQGYEVKIEPEAWAIVDGKLFLNYDLDVQKKWDADRAAFIQKADQNWSAKHPKK